MLLVISSGGQRIGFLNSIYLYILSIIIYSYYVDGIKCAEEFLNSVPCIQSHVPTLMDYFRTGTESISNLMCGEYNEQTDACAKLGKASPPSVPNTTHYLTPMSLLIDLMESIKDFKQNVAI